MNIALILAGGIGSRMGIVDKPKQFIDIYGKPVIIHTLEAFDNHRDIDYIAIACIKDWIEDLKILIRKYDISKVKWIIDGGDTRQESVTNGIKAMENFCSDDDVIVIHDSVRPLINSRIISENVEKAKVYGAVDTVIPSHDTIIKSIDDKTINNVPKRSELYLGQTPQSFKYSIIREAHKYALEKNIENATDDCQLLLAMQKNVYLVNGDKLNFKITSFEDLTLLKAIVKLGKTAMD